MMKIRIVRTTAVFLFAVLTLILIIVLGSVLAPTDNDTAIAAATIDTFHKLPENSVDLISFGSSRNWRGLNTQYLQEECNISSYNYACNWQHFNTTQQFFRDAIISQTPKIIILETGYADNFLVDWSIGGELYYTRNLRGFDSSRIAYLKQCLGGKENIGLYLSYFFPIFTFHDNWKKLDTLSFYKNPGDVDFNKTRGFVPTYGVSEVEYFGVSTESEQRMLGSQSLAILNEISNYCEKTGASLILYTSPICGSSSTCAESIYKEALHSYALEHDCVYFDMDEIYYGAGINDKTDYADPSHLNYYGATKVSEFFSEFIKNNNLI